MKEISFIHAADLHLDSPFKGLAHTPEHIFKEIRESTFHALDNLVSTAIQRKVDFILISGDLFDNEKQSLKAQIRLRKAFEELNNHDIKVYASYGNHDFINGNIYPVNYPDNVFIFPDEKVTNFTFVKDQQALAKIYGFSYENRAVHEEKAKEFHISDTEVPFHIAMLHGSIRTNSDHDVYAPFQLSDLQKELFHYWALGHIHKREILKENPAIVYPGNTQGRNRKETGEKGCFHVVLRENQTELTFIPLQKVIITPVHMDVSDLTNLHQLETKIQQTFQNISDTYHYLIDLYLTSNQHDLKEWEANKQLDEIIELINETTSSQDNWKYIFRVTTEVRADISSLDLEKGEHFIGELIRQVEDASIQPYVNELFHHKQARKYLDPLSTTEEQSIKEEAKNLLLNELLKG
ncbi:metallophosphoesterase family protein [Oceanobacillus halophilus]|nr:DNA repair exonuclease [Oceanobacillus halophilus]